MSNFTTIHSDQHDDSKTCQCGYSIEEDTTYQAHLPLAHRILNIENAGKQYPGFIALIDALDACSAPEIRELRGLALLWETTWLDEPYLCEIGRTALAMRLPPELEPQLPALMNSVPDEMNIHSMDRLESASVWALDSPDTATVYLPAHMVRAVMQRNMTCRCSPTFSRTFLPIVAVAGQSVAIGGLAVSRDWDERLGVCQSSSGCNWKPYRIYDAETLDVAAEAAKKHGGPWPLLGTLWGGTEPQSSQILLPYFA